MRQDVTALDIIRRLIAMIARPRTGGARRDAACAIAIELATVALGVMAPVLLKLAIDALTNATAPFSRAVLFIAGFVIAATGASAAGAVKTIFTMRIAIAKANTRNGP